MTSRVIVGLAMILVEGFAIFVATDRIAGFAIPVVLASSCALLGRRWKISDQRYIMAVLGLAGGLALWWAVYPPHLERGPIFFSTSGPLFYMAILFCVWHQCLQLIVTLRHKFHSSEGPFHSFPCEGVFVLSIVGMLKYGEEARLIYTAIAVCFVVLTAAFYMARDDGWSFGRYSGPMKAMTASVLLASLAAGIALAVALQRNEDALNAWFTSLTVPPSPSSTIGFSREGRLTNITSRKGDANQKPALFVQADRVPGYLRGLAFDEYRDSHWILPKVDTWLYPAALVTEGEQKKSAAREYFQIRPRGDMEYLLEYNVLTATELLDTVFLPLNATGITLSAESVAVDRAGSVRETRPMRRPGYKAIEDNGPLSAALSPEEIDRYTSLPESLDPNVRDLAASIVSGLDTPHQKAEAIEYYFVTNYEYEISMRVPGGVDPINYFLIEKPEVGYCEYFASGAAILLRASGVPARYVTGFVAVERNASGTFFVARNKDAHAWVEAWDPEEGWFIVEATPQIGVPQQRNASFFGGIRDVVMFVWQEFRDRLGTGVLNATGAALFRLFQTFLLSVYGWIFLLGIAAFAAYRWIRRRAAAATGRPLSPSVIRLQQLRERADSLAREFGFERADNETVSVFAERVRADGEDQELTLLAGWYREYERVRYRDTASESASDYLESALPTRS